MQRWWWEKDFSKVLNEVHITTEKKSETIVEEIYRSVIDG